MKQINNTNTRILYIQTNEITLLDIPRVLDEMGYEVYHADFKIKAEEYGDKACGKIVAAIDQLHIHCVISYDFVMTIAQACFEAGIPYIAWVYDAPQKELYTHYALYPGNYIFAFDRMQVSRLQNIGIKHAVHMPLAIDVDKVKMVTDTIGQKFEDGYQNEIVFIGQLYKVHNEDAVLNLMDEYMRRQLCQSIDACFLKWDKDTHMHGLMSEECATFLGRLEEHKVQKAYPYMSEQFYYEAALLSKMIANRERVCILNKLSEKYDVTFYTHDKDTTQLSEKIQIKPGMAYDVLSHIYRRSKINLNITLHCIETGVPQRVLDVMAAGGFMLSNYQEELEEMFVPGEEIVLYHNMQELEELVAYYLTHEDEREQIARKGQEKVLREYSFHKGLLRVLQYVNKAESKREVSYITIQRKELREQADILLAQKNEQAYQCLYEMYTNKLYETTIRKTTDLAILREMMMSWKREQDFGESCIFVDVANLQQAEQKYLEVKHLLWRIEQGLSHEKCVEVVEKLRQGTISKYFCAKVLYANLRDRESTFVRLSQLIAETSLAEAIEMLSYGLFFMEGSSELLMQQADFLMELNLWEQALTTMKKIKEPTEEVKDIIGQLSDALYGKNE